MKHTLMSQETIEKYEVVKTGNEMSPYVYFQTNIGDFIVMRRPRLNNDGNPIYTFTVQYNQKLGFVRELPPLEGARRNNVQQSYSTECFNIDQKMEWLLERIDQQIKTGFRMYEKL